MIRPEPMREDDFERRWSAAGARPEEARALRSDAEDALGEDAVPPSPASLQAGFQRVSERLAGRRSGARMAYSFALAGSVALVAALLVLVAVRMQHTVPEPSRSVPSRALTQAAEVPPHEPDLDSDLRSEPLTAPGHGRIMFASKSRTHRESTGEIVLDAGSIGVEVDPLSHPSQPLRFRAGDLSLEIVGTVFSLHVSEGKGSVRVFEGVVLARRGGEPPVRVDAKSGFVPSPPPVVTVESAAQRRELVALDAWARAAGEARSRSKEVATSKEVVRGAPSGPVAQMETGAKASAGRALRADRVVEASARSSEELALYRLALGLLRSGENVDAARRFSEYRDRYPQGALRDEAEISLLEALYSGGLWIEFRTEAETWLVGHGGHPRFDEVKALLSATNKN